MSAHARDIRHRPVRPRPVAGPARQRSAGLSERLAAAGGTLMPGPAPQGGFRVTAEVPVTVVA
ncbi:hypothetical protein [Streptomyces sp. NPDC086835]|uniref:hypothetical protein n=1 Tax=Streptomyces sp. NPDC086835 TaxID=3365761 RepID=UPI003824A5B2